MRICLLAVVTGCGFQLTAGVVDAPPVVDVIDAVDGVPGDTTPPIPCIASWLAHTVSLSAPVSVPGINVTAQPERDPTLTSNELVIFWVGPGPGGGDDDVWQASRNAVGESFSNSVVKQSLSDNNLADSKVTLTGDDLLGILSTARSGGQGASDLWQVSRTGGGTSAFDTIDQNHMAALNDADSQLDPFITADGLDLYYAIGIPQRIVVAKRGAKTEDFAAPVDVANLGGFNGAADPTLSADGRLILLTSNRPGGFESADLWYATRTSTSDAFGTPQLVPAVNGGYADGDAFLSLDGCRLYFASARNGGVYDLMISTVQ